MASVVGPVVCGKLKVIDAPDSSGPPSIPAYALVDRDGTPIVDRFGAYVIADPTPRTS